MRVSIISVLLLCR